MRSLRTSYSEKLHLRKGILINIRTIIFIIRKTLNAYNDELLTNLSTIPLTCKNCAVY